KGIRRRNGTSGGGGMTPTARTMPGCARRSRRGWSYSTSKSAALCSERRGSKCLAGRRCVSLPRRRLALRDGLCGQNTAEAVAILKEDEHPEHTSHQGHGNAGGRHREVEGKNVVQLRCKQDERERNEEAREQQQAANQLHREEEGGKVRPDDGAKELQRERIRRRRLMNEVEKSVKAEDRKDEAQQIACDG